MYFLLNFETKLSLHSLPEDIGHTLGLMTPLIQTMKLPQNSKSEKINKFEKFEKFEEFEKFKNWNFERWPAGVPVESEGGVSSMTCPLRSGECTVGVHIYRIARGATEERFQTDGKIQYLSYSSQGLASCVEWLVYQGTPTSSTPSLAPTSYIYYLHLVIQQSISLRTRVERHAREDGRGEQTISNVEEDLQKITRKMEIGRGNTYSCCNR